MKKTFLSILFALALCLSLLSTAALAAGGVAGGVTYFNEYGTEKTCDSYTTVESSASDATWDAGWYVVSGEVTIDGKLTINSAVDLILCDGATLKVTGGLTANDSLRIYGQSKGTGTLSVTVTVTVESTDESYDIYCKNNMRVNGGIVQNASGGAVKMRIGENLYLTANGTIQLAEGSRIYGFISAESKVKFNALPGVGCWYFKGDTQFVDDDIVESSSDYRLSADSGKDKFILIGESDQAFSFQGADGRTWNCISPAPLTDSSTFLGGGWYYSVDSDVTITETVEVTGEVHLILCDNTKLTLTGGLQSDAALHIYGQSEGTGELNVSGSITTDYGVAAIYMNESTLEINGGRVTATGGNSDETYSIGICSTGNLTVNGGTLTAMGGTTTATKSDSYGIYWSDMGLTLRVNGGKVIATGGTTNAKSFDSYGIYAMGGVSSSFHIYGGTLEATGGQANRDSYGINTRVPLTISGGEVSATGGEAAGNSGKSYGINSSDSLTISGGKVTAKGGTAAGNSGKSYGINSSGSLTISGGEVSATGGEAAGNSGGSYGIYSSKPVAISGGTFPEDLKVSGSGTVSLSGGTFAKLVRDNSAPTFAQMLKADCFYFSSSSEAKQMVTPAADATELSNVKVVDLSNCVHTPGADGKCSNCGVTIVATVTIGGETSNCISLSGIGEKIKGSTATVTLLTNASGDITVSNGDNNAATALALELGAYTMGGALTVNSGSVTVYAPEGGTLNGAVSLTGGNLTINGGEYSGAVTASGGSLAINDGSFTKVEVSSGSATIRGGTFTEIKNSKTGENITDLLAEYRAFANSDNSGVGNLYVTSLKNVTVIEHYSHTDTNTDGTCDFCGKSLVAKVTGGGTTTYYESFSSALENAAENSKLTLLGTVTLTQQTEITGKKFTLDLNGRELSSTVNGTMHRLTIGSGTELTLTGVENSKLTAYVVVSGGKLTVASEHVTLSDVSVQSDGNLVVTANATFTKLSVTGGTATLSAGKYTELTGSSGKNLKESGVRLGEGKAFCHYGRSTAWVSTTELEDASNNNLSYVTVQAAPIQSVSGAASSATVDYGYTAENAPTLTAIPNGLTESTVVTYFWYRYMGEGKPPVAISNASAAVCPIPTGLSIGEHKFFCCVTVDGYDIVSNTVTVTVNKATLSMAADHYGTPSARVGLIYNAQEQVLVSPSGVTLPVGAKYLYSLDGTNWTENASDIKGKDAKSYTVYWYIDGGTNYEDVTGTQPRTATIASKEIDRMTTTYVNATQSTTLTYTGQPQSPTFTVELMERYDDPYNPPSPALLETLTVGNDYTVDVTSQTDAGDNYELTITGRGNYTGTKTVSWSIEKADYTGTTTANGSAKYGTTGTVELSSLIMSGGTATVSDTTDTNSVLSGAPGMNGTKLQFAFANDSAKIGQTAEITVSVTGCTNYNDYTITVTVKVTDKDVPTVSANNITAVYTGSEIPASAITGTATFGEQAVAGSWSFTNAAPKNVSDSSDSVSVTFTPDDTANFATATATIKVTINKATPTGAPKYTAISTSGKTLADAALTTEDGTFSVPGTVKWVDADGNDLADATEVTANTTYKWLFTPTDSANYETLDGSIKLWVRSSSGSSGSSSKPVTPPTPPTTTTITVPVSSDAGSVEVKAEVTETDGGTATATVEISDEQIKQVAAHGSGTVTVDVSKLENVESAQVPAHVVETTNQAEDTGLTVALPTGTVALDSTALESVSKGEDINVSVKKVPATDLNEAQQKAVGDMANIGLVVDVDLTVGKEKQSAFNGGKLTISVPYTPKRHEDVSKLTVWFIHDDGTIENKGGYYDAEKGCFVFETEHLSRYVLVYDNKAPSFPDVPTTAYFYNAVNWAVAQNITNGIDDGKFGPDLGCTRGQIVTFLYRCAMAQGVDVSIGESTNILSYTDALEVPEFAFEAFQWAVGTGIIQGADGKLMPNDDCTRGQIVTMLYRYAVSTGKDLSVGEDTNILSYNDAFEVPKFATEAFQWACGAGIIQGADGKLMPNDTCTRGQIVTMLYRAMNP